MKDIESSIIALFFFLWDHGQMKLNEEEAHVTTQVLARLVINVILDVTVVAVKDKNLGSLNILSNIKSVQ